MQTVQQFFDTWNGKSLKSPQGIGGQCVDVYNQYCIDVVGSGDPLVASAYQIFTNYDTSKFDAIANTPNGIPLQGDVVVWGQSIGADGHVAIFKEGDASKFTSFDQNWPEGSVCHFQDHDYNGVTGWLHPKTQQDIQTTIDELRAARDNNWNLYNEELAKNTKLVQENQDLVMEVKQVKDSLAQQLDLNKQQAEESSASIQQGLDAIYNLKNMTSDMSNIAGELNVHYPPVSNITSAIQLLQNQVKALQLGHQNIFGWLLNILTGKKVK